LQESWGISDFDMNSVVNAGALDLIEQTINAGVTEIAARKWWMGEFSRVANEQGVELSSLSVGPVDILQVEKLIASGELTDKMARSVFEGVIAGEGSVDHVIAERGLKVVSDDSALIAAIDQALAEHPDIAEKIRSGKLQAAGAIVGAVMKSTKGQADAAKVRDLLFQQLGVTE
jgi:aspartyl-tRNA(Asn)/glutamyl-tRNA(Gln) amidotransferase subunit B